MQAGAAEGGLRAISESDILAPMSDGQLVKDRDAEWFQMLGKDLGQ